VDENNWLTDRFEESRPHLRTVAYRMLGSLSEVDDAVRDAGSGSAGPTHATQTTWAGGLWHTSIAGER
jgi:RNA polymerase sigma-70 factor (ECF subfamily)